MSQSFMPSGNIVPSRFVKLDSSKLGGYILQAGAGDVSIGISQPGTRQPPIVGLDDGYAGIADVNTVEVLTENDIGWVEAGATFSLGALLKPSTNGVAIAVAANNDFYGARALQSATAAGQLVRAKVESGYYGA